MTYVREPVTTSGTLHGNGRTANYTVSALRATFSGTKLIKNFQHSIEWVSTSLPEVDYQLSGGRRRFDSIDTLSPAAREDGRYVVLTTHSC
jgi:hypothetical protein